MTLVIFRVTCEALRRIEGHQHRHAERGLLRQPDLGTRMHTDLTPLSVFIRDIRVPNILAVHADIAGNTFKREL